jgi:flagellar assembly protein FliH
MTSSRPGTGTGTGAGGPPGREPGRERSAYTRFIPREELQGASVWMPDRLGEAFDTGLPATSAPMPWQPLDRQAAAQPVSPLQAAARAAGVVLHPEAAPRADAHGAPAAAAARPTAGPTTGRSAADPLAPFAPPAPHDSAAPDLRFDLADAPAAANAAGAAATAEQASAELARLQALQAEQQAGWEARLEAEVAAARQAGYQDGYRDGLEALESFKSSYAQQVTTQVGQVLQSLDGELRQLEQETAASLARVAIALARQVVRSELQTHPDLVTQVAQEAVNAIMTGTRHLTVKVHPDDHGLIAQGCAETLAARGARLVAEPSLERGGCLVETEAGGVDARIATRWAAVMQTMGSAEPWQAGTGHGEPAGAGTIKTAGAAASGVTGDAA